MSKLVAALLLLVSLAASAQGQVIAHPRQRRTAPPPPPVAPVPAPPLVGSVPDGAALAPAAPPPSAAPVADLSLALSVDNLVLVQGHEATVVVTVSSIAGFNETVTLRVSGMPAGGGLGAKFDATALAVSPGSPQSTILHVSVDASLEPASYPLSFQASAAGGALKTGVLNVNVVNPTYNMFSQGALEFFNSVEDWKPLVSVQALDFFFFPNQAGALHIRTTLPASTATPTAGTPSSVLKQQLLDIFGGNVNASLNLQWAKGGFSSEGGAAMKVVEVPKTAVSTGTPAPATGGTATGSTTTGSTTTGGTGSATGSSSAAKQPDFEQALFTTFGGTLRYEVPGVTPAGDKGTLTLVASGFISRASSAEVPLRFTTPLQRVVSAANFSAVLNVPGSHIYVVAQGRISNDPAVGRQFSLSFNPVR